MPKSGQGPARRLSDARETEILAATLAIFSTRGMDGLTMDDLAAAARTSKATLYRLWEGKLGLVVSALQRFHPNIALSDTGSLRGDLLALLQSDPLALRDGSAKASLSTTALLSEAVHASRAHPEIGTVLREQSIGYWASAVDTVIEQAVARGEVPPSHPLRRELGKLVVYAVLGRMLVEGVAPGIARLTEMIDNVVLPAFGLAGPTAAPSPGTPAKTGPPGS